ncbi:TPA: 2-dehydro-3-deoxygalactonokinase [Serratia odorifera]|nr:2-dehydro-3-deoxygalactonokinase [Serratia odorifera]
MPLVMAGMVGSQQGWHEAACFNQPRGLNGLAAGAIKLTANRSRPAWIIHGVQRLGLPLNTMDGDICFINGLSQLYPLLPGVFQ